MENLSLYDLLVGCFVSKGDRPEDVDDSYFKKKSEDEKLRTSIIENLRMVLQSRGGAVRHLPDFGIPDFRKIYLEDKSFDSIAAQIKKTIEKYEPRLESIEVRQKRIDPKRSDNDRVEKDLRIEIEIYAKIKETKGREIFMTEFSTTGWLKVISRQLEKAGNPER
ncbi:MAG: type VI secretion system baseplate subunit TssE [Calditrichaeota bacterium]|nr:MAG: type VI secretion system baseplate subunit TssE [Calditrichota bacterium]